MSTFSSSYFTSMKHCIPHLYKKDFKRNSQLWVWYSFIRDIWVSYTLVYDDAHVFVYKKTKLSSPEYTQEDYIGSDSFLDMLTLIDSTQVLELGIQDDIIIMVRRWILERRVVEIHYSYNNLENDSTLYIYSEDITYLESILRVKFNIPFFDLVAEDMSMYCLKLKIKPGTKEYSSSIVFTSKNREDGTAYTFLRDSYFFAWWFGDITFPTIISKDNQFYTFEVAYNLTSHRIENFILFYMLRHKAHA